jgi:hypothetical protein
MKALTSPLSHLKLPLFFFLIFSCSHEINAIIAREAKYRVPHAVMQTSEEHEASTQFTILRA